MSRLADALLAACLISVVAPQKAGAQNIPLAASGSATAGERLFIGAARFRNGGPACISCHSIAGLPFPNGGTLGPDLTHAYKKLGPAGTQSAIQTLYFKVMSQIYGAHPLLPDEQADIMSYLEHAESAAQPEWNTQILLLAALALCAVFIALTGFLWRDRVRSVRRALVERATRQGARV